MVMTEFGGSSQSYSICPLTNEELNLSVSGILTSAAIGTSGTILKPKYVKLIQVSSDQLQFIGFNWVLNAQLN